MPRILWLVTIVSGFVFLPAKAAEVRLSPDGEINTLVKARDAARSLPKPAKIVVADGRYELSETLQLEAADSGVTWEAAARARPLFSGGRKITGWEKAEGNLWRAILPAEQKQWVFEQLWINGRRATLARTPNKGYLHIAEACSPNVFEGIQALDREAFSLYAKDYELIRAIPKEEWGQLLITVTHAWAVGQCKLADLNDATRAVRIKGKSRYPFVTYEADQRFWLENYRAALDAPGEWFLDQQKGELLYYPLPGEDMTKVEVTAPVVSQFAVINGASDISFKGLRFQHGQDVYPAEGLHDGQAASTIGAVFEVADSRNIHWENCEIAHIGTYAIYFKNGCSESSVKHSHLHDLGAGGVRIGEIAKPEEERVCRHIVIDDCIIQHAGRRHPSACGVLITHGQHCVVRHCDIGDLYYTGVSIGWNWGYGESLGRANKVENCHIHHLGWAYLSDMGGFYGLGNAPGTEIRGNHVHHIASHRYGGWGLYTDEGSGDVLFENNLVHDTSESGFHQHYGYANRIKNNIFAFGKKAQIQRSRNETRLTFTYERNIVVWDPASPLLDGGEWNWKFNDKAERGDPKDSVIFRHNLYWPTDGKIPELLTKTVMTWKEWQAMGRDKGSLFEDPLFVDLAARDFRLKDGSPAAKIKFKPWDHSVAGVRKEDKAWRELAAKGHVYPAWEEDAKPWPAPPFSVPLQTFEHQPIGGLGIRGASWNDSKQGESIGVSDEAASPFPVDGMKESKQSLRIKDSTALEPTYLPVLDIRPRWQDDGTFEARFDIMAQPGADWFFEMRNKEGVFAAGPYLRWRNGKLAANNDKTVSLADVPAGEWIRVVITAKSGAGKWQVQLTRQDGSTQQFAELPNQSTWTSASYLLFSSIGKSEASFFIDNFSLHSLP